MQADFKKRELRKFLKLAKIIGEGYFGICYEHNNDYLIKAYVDEYHRNGFREIFKEINESKIQEEFYLREYDYNYTTTEERIKERMHRLAYTKYNYDLIQGLAYYDNYCFGCILSFYKGYSDLEDKSLALLRKDAIELLFHNIDVSLNDLMKNHIYPTDIKADNVLFDQNLNIKLIDLDDNCTIYMNGKSEKLERDCKSRVLGIKEDILNEKNNK